MFINWIKDVSTIFFNRYGFLCIIVFLAILFDIITGLLKGVMQKKINSKIAAHGFFKKIALLVALMFGFFLDLTKIYLLEQEEVFSGGVIYDMSKILSFGHLVGIYIVINEGISILENLTVLGVKMPNFITKILNDSKDDMDK